MGIEFLLTHHPKVKFPPKMAHFVSIDNLFDKYGHILYGVAIKCSPSKSEAERILCAVFKKIDLDEINRIPYNSVCYSLMSAVVRLAREEFRFERTSISNDIPSKSYLDKMYFKESTLDEICIESNKTRFEIALQIREELKVQRNKKNMEIVN